MREYSGELVRVTGCFALAGDDGRTYALELPRVPVDLVGKNVVVTGEPGETDDPSIVAHHIRGQD